jgi:hypothetical protein
VPRDRLDLFARPKKGQRDFLKLSSKFSCLLLFKTADGEASKNVKNTPPSIFTRSVNCFQNIGNPCRDTVPLNVHENVNFLGSDFEFCIILLLVPLSPKTSRNNRTSPP